MVSTAKRIARYVEPRRDGWRGRAKTTRINGLCSTGFAGREFQRAFPMFTAMAWNTKTPGERARDYTAT